MTGRLVVIGSLNVDLVVAGVPLPRPGQTVTGGHLETHQGGKGGNAAVAAARALRAGPAEGRVGLAGAVGDDPHGQAALDALRAESIDVAHVATRRDVATGVALIVVDPRGENQIAVAPGANATLTAGEAGAAAEALLRDGGVLLASLEVPTAALEAAARAARARGALVMVNPAPVAAMTAALLDLAHVLTPNQGELDELGGRAALLAGRPDLQLVVTLGGEGLLVVDGEGERRIPALQLAVVDTTGAGDTLSGVLAAGLLEGLPWLEAVRRAGVAASLSVTIAGAREGMPERAQIDRAM
ncbi:MAG: PfkB family carbohydrate kinase [Candidatus Limnocylindrales bacterium]